jgi:hypothetical protein
VRYLAALGLFISLFYRFCLLAVAYMLLFLVRILEIQVTTTQYHLDVYDVLIATNIVHTLSFRENCHVIFVLESRSEMMSQRVSMWH